MSGSLAPVFRRSARDRRGQSLVMFALLLAALLGMMALAVDIGYLYQVRAKLQSLSDAAALAAAQELPSQANARTVAVQYANENDGAHGTIVAVDEVVVGNWDGLGSFIIGGNPINAVRVVARRTTSRDNSVALFFARVLGFEVANVSAWSTATAGGKAGEETVTRFIIDEEFIKTDPAKKTLENLAATMGKSYDWITSDNDGDWFIDIPPGTKLKSGTGQTGDEGLFDITHNAFPFLDGSNGKPSFQDFLNYNNDNNTWRYNLIPESLLDPLYGVTAVSHNHLYPGYINPDKCQVSPILDSDVSNLGTSGGVPRVNAKGMRRGVLAFSLDSIAEDPDGRGSVLPRIWITVCDPTPYIGGGGVVTLPIAADLPLRLVQ